jgi:hypothetical protein
MIVVVLTEHTVGRLDELPANRLRFLLAPGTEQELGQSVRGTEEDPAVPVRFSAKDSDRLPKRWLGLAAAAVLRQPAAQTMKRITELDAIGIELAPSEVDGLAVRLFHRIEVTTHIVDLGPDAQESRMVSRVTGSDSLFGPVEDRCRVFIATLNSVELGERKLCLAPGAGAFVGGDQFGRPTKVILGLRESRQAM